MTEANDDVASDWRIGSEASHSSSHSMSGSYSSPISGFINLPEVDNEKEEDRSRKYMVSKDSLLSDSTGVQSEMGEVEEEEESIDLGSLGLRSGPFQQDKSSLSKQVSTQTLRQYGHKSPTQLVDDVRWPACDSFDATKRENKYNPHRLSNGLDTTHAGSSRSFWSTGDQAAKDTSENDHQSASNCSSSMSLSVPQKDAPVLSSGAKESWDDDFLFQDGDQEDGDNCLDTERVHPLPLAKDDREENILNEHVWDESDDEDWNKENGKDLPVLARSRVTQYPISGVRPGAVLSAQSAGLDQKAMPLTRTQQNYTRTAASRLESRRAHNNDVERCTSSSIDRHPQSHIGARQLGLQISAQEDQNRRNYMDDGYEKQQDQSANTKPVSPHEASAYSRRRSHLEKAEPSTPSRDQHVRSSEGHWSHFLNSRLGRSKSPAAPKRFRGQEDFETSTTTSSPEGARFDAQIKTKAMPSKVGTEEGIVKPKSHRKGGASLSMSFGLGQHRSRSGGTLSPATDSVDSLAVGSAFSTSSDSVIANNGRLEEDHGAHRPPEPMIHNTDPHIEVQKEDRPITLPDNTVRTNKRKVEGAWREANAGSLSMQASVPSRTLRKVPSRSREQTARGEHLLSRLTTPAIDVGFPSELSSKAEKGTSPSTRDGSLVTRQSATSKTKESGHVASDYRSWPEQGSSSKTSDVNQPESGGAVVKKPSTRRIRVSISKSKPSSGVTNRLGSHRMPQEITVGGDRLLSDPSSPSLPEFPHASAADEHDNSIDSLGRRSSLGDLKIPSRISKAQEGIRANVANVKRFAYGIERLKSMRAVYHNRLSLLPYLHPTRVEVEEEFESWWECAEVLISLGEGRGGDDAEADVQALEMGKISVSPGLDGPGSPSSQTASPRRPSGTIRGSSQPSVKRLPQDSRSASSRASSARSLDPQREMDILSAMLAGTPVEDISPGRSTDHRTARERTMSATCIHPASASPPRGSSSLTMRRQSEVHGRLPLADSSTTSLSFADAPHPSRMRSRNDSTASHMRAGHEHSRIQVEPYDKDNPTWRSAAFSKESIDTQIATRRRRLRSAGRAGLQGLKELLRTFKLSSAAIYNQIEGSRSRVSLSRTMTDESFVSLDLPDSSTSWTGHASARQRSPLDDGKENSPLSVQESVKGISRTRSMFSKSASYSPSLHRSRGSESAHSGAKSCAGSNARHGPTLSLVDCQTVMSSSPGGRIGLARRTISQGSWLGGSTEQDCSLDSEWTQSDFEPQSLADEYHAMGKGSEQGQQASSSGCRKRFSLFSKGFPPSASRRQSRNLPDWSKQASRESLVPSPPLPLEKLALSEVRTQQAFHVSPNAPTGMPRASSHSKHPLLYPDETAKARPQIQRRSVSASSGPASSTAIFFAGQRPANRPSISSTISTAKTKFSNSSNSNSNTSSATPTLQSSCGTATTGMEYTICTERSTSDASTPSSVPSSALAATGAYRKLALKPEAIPSLLVYLETTQTRCQESIRLLDGVAI